MQKKQKRSTWVILLCAAALLALVILLENTMKPAWPREKRPVKPLSRFMEEATTA